MPRPILVFYCCKCVMTASFLGFLVAFAYGQTSHDRLRQPIDDTRRIVLSGNLHPLARPEFDRGRVDSEMAITRAALSFHPSAAQQNALDALLARQQDRSSPYYHRWLTPEQYADRFGLSQNDVAKISAWLRSHGLNVHGASRGRTEIYFSGTAAQVEDAFATELHRYVVNGEEHFALSKEPSVPAALSEMIPSFRSLDNFRPKSKLHRVSPNFTSSFSPGRHFLVPNDFAKIYDVNSSFDGTGVKIAIVGQSAISTTDIDAFRANAALPPRTAGNFQQVLVAGSGASTHCSGDETESDLDSEWSEGVAKGATIIFVYTGVDSGKTCLNTSKSAWDSLFDAINNMRAPVISTSYGLCEAALPPGFPATVQTWAQQAKSQGQTVVAASGDNGAADCEANGVASATTGPAVDVPASVPEVTGVGGTEFTGDPDSTGDTTYWAAATSNDSGGGSAKSYIPEIAWNDTKLENQLAASGGGVSKIFAKPGWQTVPGVPTDGKRDVPDIALNASNNHDSYLICSQDFFTSEGSNLTSCANGYRASDNQSLAAVGGTSVGAPAFAGILAIAIQATGSNLGDVNPTLYALSSTNAFHDITSGDNIVPCKAGSTGCPASHQFGFMAGTGYDPVTGLGSVNASNFVNALIAASTNPGFTLSPSPSTITISAPGGFATSTITVSPTNGFTGTVTLTCAAFTSAKGISCTPNPTSVTLNGSSQTTTVTVTTQMAQSASTSPGMGLWLGAGSILAGILAIGAPVRQRRRMAILGLFVITSFALSSGCGGGSSSNNNSNSNNGTPVGSYAIAVITGTGGGTTVTQGVTVTVQ